MTSYYLDLYADFVCLAGNCPSTCCAGWRIVVDQAAKERFEQLDDEGLRRDILNHLQYRGGEYCFQNQPDGRCSMLDADGLCRIQRNLDEKSLCNTCRKFPRLSAKVGEEVWMSMAASCPVVASYLWRQEPGWIVQDDSGRKKPFCVEKFAVVRSGVARYEAYCRRLQQQNQERQKLPVEKREWLRIREGGNRFALFLDLVDGCLELLLQFPERTYLEGSFDYFEREDIKISEIIGDICTFEQDWKEPFFTFFSHYLVYRLFSRYLEYPSETEERRYCQVIGELTLMYLILLSRYHTLGGLEEKHILETIDWVYRFCAHGAVVSGKMTEVFCHCFRDIMNK